MADEPVVEPIEPVVEPGVEPIEQPEPPHPLAPGGPRFEEVYRQMKEERDARIRAEADAAALRQQMQPRQQQSAYVTPDQLQALIDRGQITPMQATDFLSKQNAQLAATQTTTAAIQMTQLNAKVQAAATEVNQFIEKMPTLRNTASPEFQKVADAAYALSDDMNLPVTDFRVQRAALRQVYGSLDRVAGGDRARQQTRDASLPHVESGVSGGRTVSKPAGGDEALKGVSQHYIDFWTKRGYTKEQMIEEAKYVTKEPRQMKIG